MKISGFQKLTLLDYPNMIACIIFTSGCNFNCSFCHNSLLVNCKEQEIISEEEVFEYLNKRIKVLDGVVISGGEPTIQTDLKRFISRIKSLGLKVKLDTNGYKPEVLKDLLDNDLLDYVAMDIKSNQDNYNKVSNIKKLDYELIKDSIKLLKESKVDYEFRTTIMKEYHNLEVIKDILKMIGKDTKYYLQNFKDSENVPDHKLTSFNNEELVKMQKELNELYPNVIIRDI